MDPPPSARVTHRDESQPWQVAQRHCFMGWVNHQLGKAGEPPINNIKTAWSSGVVLHKLLASLSGEKVGPLNAKPTMKVQKIENLSFCLNFMKSQGIHFENMGPLDIYEENYTLIMGMLWKIISHYQVAGQIQQFDKSHQEATEKEDNRAKLEQAKKNLLEWCKTRCAAHGVEVNNFKSSWADGSAFSSLVATIDHGHNYWDHEEDSVGDKMDSAFDFAENPLGIPQLLQSETMQQAQDEKSIMTYLALIYEKYKDASILVSERKAKYSFKLNPEDLGPNGEITAIVDVEKSLRASVFSGGAQVDGADLPNVEFKLRGVGGGETGEVVSDFGKGGEGMVKVTGREVGDQVLEMWVGGEMVEGKRVVVKGPELKWGGEGSGGAMVGQKKELFIDLVGEEGEGEGELLKRREHLSVVVRGPGGEEVAVEVGKAEGGGLGLGFVPEVVGGHEVRVLYKGVEIGKKEVNAYTLEWGSGMEAEGNRATVGVLSEFELGVVGGNGRVGGEEVEVVLVGEGGKEVKCQDMGEGEGGKRKYGYVPREAGEFQLEVRVKGEKVGGVGVEVMELEAEWGGDGLEGGVVGERGEFEVSFFDGDGEMVKVAEAPVVRVMWMGEEGEREEVEVEMEMGEEESVGVGYVPKKMGKHLVEVVVGDMVVKSKVVPVFDVLFRFGEGWERDEEGRAVLVVDVPKVVGVQVLGGVERGKVQVGLRNVATGEDIVCEWTEEGEWEGKGEGWRGCVLCGTALGVHELLVMYEESVIGKGGRGGENKREKEVMVKKLFLESWGGGLKVGVCGRPTHFFSIFREKEGGMVVETKGRFVPKVEYKEGGVVGGVTVREGEGENGEAKEGVNKVEYTPGKVGRVVVGQWYRTWEERKDEATIFGMDLVGLGDGGAMVGVASGFEVGLWDNEEGRGVGGLPEGVEVVWMSEGGEAMDCVREGEGGEGRTKCSFVPKEAGGHVVEVRVGGEVLCREEVKVRGVKVEVGGFGAETGVVGVEGGLFVRFRDGESGELVDVPEGVEVEVEGNGGEMLEVMERGEKEGGKGFGYVPKEVGKTKMRVKVGGKEVFAQDLDVYKFVIGKQEGGDVLVNEPNSLSVEVLGEGGKKVPLKDLEEVTGRVLKKGGDEGENKGKCEIVGDEEMSFSVEEIGENDVCVYYKGVKVGGAEVRGIGPTASGEGLEVAFLGFPATFVVQYPEVEGGEKKKKKSSGSKVKKGGSKLKKEKKEKGPKREKKEKKGGAAIDLSRIRSVVTVDGAPVEVEAVKVGDRAIEYSYVATTPGEVKVDISNNGSTFFSNQFGVVVPDWVVSGSGSKFAKCDMENYFHVAATDPRNGNNLLGSNGKERVRCRVKPPGEGELGVRCQFHPKRGMGGVFTPKLAGEHRVQILSKEEREGQKERVLYEFSVPTCRYDFDGDAMMGCCAKMEAKFSLEIFAEEGADPLPPDEIVTSIKYVESEGEVAELKEVKSDKDVMYSFTPMNPGEVEILVEHKGNVVYQGQLQVGLPRFRFTGEGAERGIIGQDNTFQTVQLHPYTLESIPQNLFFVKALMKDPNDKILPMRKKLTLEGEYTCNYQPKMVGDHKVLISIDGNYLEGDGVPHVIPCVTKESLQAAGLITGEKGILKIYLEEDEVLSSMNLSNTFKMINITDDTRSGEVKRLMIDKMSKQLDDVQISKMYQHCMYFCIAEVPIDAEERKVARKAALRRLGGKLDPSMEDVDPEGRRVLRNETVWNWRHAAGKTSSPSMAWPGVETVLVFKELIGKNFDFQIHYPRRGMTNEALGVTMKIRDPSKGEGGRMVNDHKGELECRVRTPRGATIEVPGEKGVGDGEHCIPFVPTEPGVHFFSMYFNGAKIHEKAAKVSIHQRSSVSVLNRFFS